MRLVRLIFYAVAVKILMESGTRQCKQSHFNIKQCEETTKNNNRKNGSRDRRVRKHLRATQSHLPTYIPDGYLNILYV